jgi:hypothetical protein
MLETVQDSGIRTVTEFRNLYPNKWFHYIVLDPTIHGHKVRVTHIADTKEEIYSVSDAEFMQAGYKHFGILWGICVNSDPGMHIDRSGPTIYWN